VAQNQYNLIFLDKFLVCRHRTRRLKTVLDAHEFNCLAVDAAFSIEILHGIDASLRDILPLIRGRSGEVHEIAELNGALRLRFRAQNAEPSEDGNNAADRCERVTAHRLLLSETGLRTECRELSCG